MKNSILSRLVLPVVVATVCLGASVAHAALPQVFNPNNAIFVRPGGTSFTWTYSTGTTPEPGFTGTYNVTQISYHDVGPPINWTLTRGRFEFSTNSGSTWSTYAAGTGNTTNFTTISGNNWRFVDTSGNTTTSNSIGFGYFLGGGPTSSVGTGATIIPDNAPTDMTADRTTVFDTLPQGSTLATVTPVDTGATRDGWWVLESQSVPNLFAISFNRTVDNKVALTKSTGTMPAIGTVVTATLRYYDLYQTDSSGNPIGGQGFSKQLSFTVTSEVSNALTLGNDVPVNTFTTNNQSAPSVAALTTGNLAVVWQSASQGGKSPATNSGIYGQLLSSTGAAVGSEFVVSNAGAAVDEITPAVTALASGRYVVAYSKKSGADYDIAYRIVEANGTLGSQLIANSTTAGDQSGPSIVTLTDGSFVIAWYSSTGEIRARQFAAAAGAPVAAEVLFDSAGSYASVAALSNGSYAVAWVDGNSGVITVKVNGGSTVGTGIESSFYAGPRLAGLTGGGFVLASESYNVVMNQSQIEVARYNDSGVIQGAKFRANTVTTGNRYAASVAGLTGGGFVVGWMADNGDFELNGIFGRRYTSGGVAVDASEFQINQHRAGDQAYPAMAAMPSDAFATVWTDVTAASVTAGTYLGDIEARIFTVAAPTGPTVTATTTAVNANASSVTITGTNFDTTAANNTVAFTPTGTGTVTAATSTSLTVSVSGLRAGTLNAVVTNGSGNSGAAVQVATVKPVVTQNLVTTFYNGVPSVTFSGFGFDPTPANNTVAFPGGVFGTVASATATSLTVTITSAVSWGAYTGIFTANVTTNGQSSGVVQIGNVAAGVPPVPEIVVTETGIGNVADGGSFSFGTTTVGTFVTKLFTVTNSGTANLTLGNLTVPSGFTILLNFSLTNLTPGNNATFAIRMTAGAAGTPSGTLSFDTNDSDENPYDFTISGTVNVPAPTVTASTADLLNTATTLTITGTNFSTTPGNNTVAFSPSGTGTVTASTATSLTVTSLSGLTPGALNAVVTTNGQNSSAPVQVAYVVATTGGNGYDNTTTVTGSLINGGAPDTTTGTFLIADDITFAPGSAGRVISAINFEVANTDTVTFTARARLRVWAANGAGGGPGTLLASSVFAATSLTASSNHNFNSTANTIAIPANEKVWVGVMFDGVGGTATVANLNNLGLVTADPPTVGSSANLFFKTTNPGSNNVSNPVGSTTSGSTPVGSLRYRIDLAGSTAPIVATAGQSAVTTTTATLGGNVTASGGTGSVSERGIVWSTSLDPTTADNKVPNGSGLGSFSGTVTGLPSGTTIHVRAYAINLLGTGYGPDISFTTLVPPSEIAVSYNGNDVADGSVSVATLNGTDFGNVPVQGVTVDHVFTITNSGAGALTLGSVTAGGDFTVTQPTSPVAANGGTSTFTVSFNPSATGTRTATITFTNNDGDESPFDFVVSGVGTGPRTFDLAGNAVSNTPFDGGQTYIYSLVVGPPPPAPVAAIGGQGVVTGADAPDGTGADSGLDFDMLTRGGFIAENGHLAFPGELTGPGVDGTNFKGFWKHNGTLLSRLARTGDNAPETGATAAKFSDLPLIPGINDAGQVTLFAALATNPGSTPPTTVDNDTGLWSELGGTGFQILMREGDDIPTQVPPLPAGTKLGAFGFGCFASADTGAGTAQAAFTAKFKGGSTDSALLRASILNDTVTAVDVVARENDTAPGVAGQTFGTLNSTYTGAVRMDAQGNIVFGAVLKPSNKTSIWYQPVAGGDPAAAVVAGDVAPGTSSATFAAVDVPVMGGNGTFAFRGVLTANTGDNTGNAKNDGIWKSVAGATSTNILRRGDSNTNRPGLFTGAILTANPNIKAGNIWSGWLTNSNHGAWLGWVDLAGNGISAYPADTFGIYTDIGPEGMKLLIASGDPAPDIAGATLFFVDHPVVSGTAPTEHLAFIATVTGGGTTAGVNDKGIWRSLNGAAPTLVLRTGDSMTVTPGGAKTIEQIDLPGSGDAAHIWETPVMDANGRLLVFIKFDDGTTTQVIVP